MIAAELRTTIDKTHSQIVRLEDERAGWTEQLQRALAADAQHYDERTVRYARVHLTDVEHRLVDLSERVMALEAQLPSDDAVKKAEANAAVLLTALGPAHRDLSEAWLNYMAAIAQAETGARALMIAKRAARNTTEQLTRLSHEFGLDVSIPGAPRLSPDDERHALLVLDVMRDVLFGEPADLLRALDARHVTPEPAPELAPEPATPEPITYTEGAAS